MGPYLSHYVEDTDFGDFTFLHAGVQGEYTALLANGFFISGNFSFGYGLVEDEQRGSLVLTDDSTIPANVEAGFETVLRVGAKIGARLNSFLGA